MEANGATTYQGRGIWFFDGRVACPLAGVGARGAHAANRLVIEDERATVTIDRARARIDVASRGAYPEKALVADLTFLADGVTERGERSPLAIHLEIYREGDRITLDLHRHLRTRDALIDADFEAFTVVVEERGAPRTVLDRDIALAMIRHPSLTHRAIKALMAMKDHLEDARQDLGKPGFAVADLELGFGLGPLSKMLVRARLTSLRPATALSGARTAAELFQRGAWELELIALSEKHLAEVIKRDLMLFGIDRVPLLAPVLAHGLRRGQRLAFRFEGGTGEIVLDGAAAPLEDAADVARAYLEFHMLGGFLAEYAERFARTLAS
jgi:hypothetical protein